VRTPHVVSVSWLPLVVGTIARFDVTVWSTALRVAASGCAALCGYSVKQPNDTDGITVAFTT
jgi:hypothetical protein